ncbi:Proteinaceous RNase P 1, chloroplastic/mitochondrial [Apostasia shenzhenica]|uniref:ribonuclease P n=1 Tax=Apostasia shenzhenica TaxID=1088818 RepID=A0A2I0BAA6_9ASPA|nr:Proteinaceous RNase P 1, chloroplastic/mitochondrial [Apostasia shenzhenica]
MAVLLLPPFSLMAVPVLDHLFSSLASSSDHYFHLPHKIFLFSPLLATPFHAFSVAFSSSRSHGAKVLDIAPQTEAANVNAFKRSPSSSWTFSQEQTPAHPRGNGGFKGNDELLHPELSSLNGKPKEKKKVEKRKLCSEEAELRFRLDMCSKAGAVMGAISLYDKALTNGLQFQQYHYNVLLYLCSSAATGFLHPGKSGRNGDGEDEEEERREVPIQLSQDARAYCRRRGFEIYEKMRLEEVPMSEAAMTSVARMAMAVGDGEMAFRIVRRMKEDGITPRLRSYGPAIFAFCNSGEIDRAFEVERDMVESGIIPEEPELEALLQASVKARKGEKLYYLLHRFRAIVRQVSPSTADIIQSWFESSAAARFGRRKVDRKKIEQALENGGGGWHGLGWLGKGKWSVVRTHVDDDGVCSCCGEKLVAVDLDPVETESFAESVASMANKKERNSSFDKFQKWLDYYGPFEAVIDAANVGLFNHRRFSVNKVNAVANGMRQKLPSKKLPLVVVHNKRLTGGKMNEPVNQKLIEKWRNADALYATPTGSNDDWYWLYAAIKCKCLIVTNDEMRDHVFQVLGNDFFPKWKERHQVHFSYQDGSFQFHMPPPCSVVIQESERGHWHIPIAEHKQERSRSWMCVTRANRHMKHRASSALVGALGDSTSKLGGIDEEGSHSPPQILHRKSHKGAHQFANLQMVSAIEAAEKVAGCVIDFQI